MDMGGGKEEAVLPPARPQLPLSLVWTSPGESPPSEPLRVTGTGAPRNRSLPKWHHGPYKE